MLTVSIILSSISKGTKTVSECTPLKTVLVVALLAAMDYYTPTVMLFALGVVIGSLRLIIMVMMVGCRSKNMPPGQPGPDSYYDSCH